MHRQRRSISHRILREIVERRILALAAAPDEHQRNTVDLVDDSMIAA
jgi:hypothetical protein